MDPRIQLVINFMNANLNQRMSLSRVASVANLSPYHFWRLFKNQTGLSPEQHLRVLRMEEAHELLATTLLSIKQIMAMVGYNDKSHFARDFRKAFGVAPSEYREQFLDLILLQNRLLQQDRKIG